ncbi:Gfo/Idh/MocA family protein [Alicyclobacillus macrosporangiidus]|uniref:Predicted dehydrogenase n=1 Tax=Alicyclobacillus macrosporangiidus TaxID=392015 RepID=A0A1I7KW82_9BACL|nr:Gfo/Idh/MocA family oxidoreductase [Alicyclobacillus macrosporangiidus]SFV01685.1 Predicted dehydrogenase [Alicyclobacillus macrosporangiidus]
MNVAIIGCGYIGEKHVQGLAQVPGIRLSAVCDTEVRRAEEFADRYRRLADRADTDPVQVCSTYGLLLEDSRIDAVSITVPSGLHATIAMAALRAGKHVILEKPMALSTGEARSLVALSVETGRKLAVCHQKRFYPHLQHIRTLVASGRLGQIVFGTVSLAYNRTDEYYQSIPWRGTWAMDGGVLLNQAIHDIDLLLWFMGNPVSVLGQVQRLLRPMEAEDTAAAVVAMADGGIAAVTATVCAPKGHSEEYMTLVGTRGALTLSGKTMQPTSWKVEEEPVPEFVDVDPYARLYKDFSEAVAENRDPFVSGKEALPALETIFGVYSSSLRRSGVRLPAEDVSTLQMNNVFTS